MNFIFPSIIAGFFFATTAWSQSSTTLVQEDADPVAVASIEAGDDSTLGDVSIVELAACAAKSLTLAKTMSEMIGHGSKPDYLGETMRGVKRKSMIISSAFYLLLQEKAKRDTSGKVMKTYADATAQMEDKEKKIGVLAADLTEMNKVMIQYEIQLLQVELVGCEQLLIIAGPAKPYIHSPAPSSLAASNNLTVKPVSAWVSKESRSDMTDEPTVVLRLITEKPKTAIPGANYQASLFLRCSEDTTAVYFIFGGAFVSDNGVYGKVS